MVSKKLGEEEVKGMFSQFGPIEDCTVLRDDNGISRGEILPINDASYIGALINLRDCEKLITVITDQNS